MGAAGILPELARAQRQVIEAFRGLGATSPQTAQPLSKLALEQSQLDQLLAQGIVRQPEATRFYLDEVALSALADRRRRIGIPLLIAFAVLLFGLLAYTIFIEG